MRMVLPWFKIALMRFLNLRSLRLEQLVWELPSYPYFHCNLRCLLSFLGVWHSLATSCSCGVNRMLWVHCFANHPLACTKTHHWIPWWVVRFGLMFMAVFHWQCCSLPRMTHRLDALQSLTQLKDFFTSPASWSQREARAHADLPILVWNAKMHSVNSTWIVAGIPHLDCHSQFP